MVKKRMGIEYLNPNMEGVRQVALRNFREIYAEINKDLDFIKRYVAGEIHEGGHEDDKFLNIIKKWKEI